ncbi:Similar to spop: Speckle-type POZ protein (Xenopus tropicalis) [Cotesia congregata]|uniref:Similar to spop: Speckle-type POZ protein (Xenopus tropicalis) n=1 Tax=Cotesia congregata TaxID=51543 RepID=A0A8J2MQD4_COTCN|nr:Similar to spop: Speckle-type POZ protein (Xenopus tropicalis) [Cotesia congregata]
MMPKNFSFARPVKREKLSNYELELLVNDSLTIHTEITVKDDARTILIKNFCSSNSANQLANDLERFYQSKINTDVTFIVGDKKFQAHKTILSSRSPVLAAMFTHDMIEKKTSRVSVKDITPEIFEKFLNYMYTDRVANLDVVALDLLKAADMHQLQSLIHSYTIIRKHQVFQVEKFFRNHRYRAETLKEHAIKYVVDGKRDVINTDGFKKLEKNNPSLALELLKRVMETKCNYSETIKVIETKVPQITSHILAFDKSDFIFKSSEFSTGAKLGDLWEASIRINNYYASELKAFISVHVQNMSNHVFTARVKFFIVNYRRQQLLLNHLQYKFSPKAIIGFNEIIPKRWLLGNKLEFLPEDTLTLDIVVSVTDYNDDLGVLTIKSENLSESSEENSIDIKSPKFYNSSKTSLADDLERLYWSKDDTDITIVVEGRRFPAHKIFLKMRSQFLAELLSQDTTKKDLLLEDIKSTIFEKVLKFIYTDRADNLGDAAAQVLEAADKFQLETLKTICEESLSRSLNRENFIEIISLADRHFAINLKNYALEFFGAISEDIVNSYEFMKLENTNSYLALELFKKFHIFKINSLKINSGEGNSA